ncbi:hypothetical protein SASPL_131546 [Salvia splendens]|uniref:Uncharacterized protein n=1 Tax=Salvia splendens TaxID=180675 RepID=A0A8X8X811_SALSN|nr:hypothetical protein SASPL_131546 [Salvia splendens]
MVEKAQSGVVLPKHRRLSTSPKNPKSKLNLSSFNLPLPLSTPQLTATASSFGEERSTYGGLSLGDIAAVAIPNRRRLYTGFGESLPLHVHAWGGPLPPFSPVSGGSHSPSGHRLRSHSHSLSIDTSSNSHSGLQSPMKQFAASTSLLPRFTVDSRARDSAVGVQQDLSLLREVSAVGVPGEGLNASSLLSRCTSDPTALPRSR